MNFFLVNDKAVEPKRLAWIAPAPTGSSSFGMVSQELLKRLKPFQKMYMAQGYTGPPKQTPDYLLVPYHSGEHILYWMDKFKPQITVMFQSPFYLYGYSPTINILKDQTRLIFYTPMEANPVGTDLHGLFNMAETILVPSNFSRECLRQYGHESTVLYHGVDPETFHPAPKPAQFTIGSIASHVWRKQLTRIVQAHKKALAKTPDIRCLIYASTYDMAPWMPDIRMYAKNVNPEVYFNESAYFNIPLNQATIARLYDQLHCHVLTSTEAFGLPNVEAMASATVPIIINDGASPEIVGDAGIYARVKDYLDLTIGKVALVDVDDLADKIVWAKQNPEALKTLAAKGIDRAKQYSWNDITDNLEIILAT